MNVLAIDPGTTHSGAVLYNGKAVIASWNHLDNYELLSWIRNGRGCQFQHLAIEMIASYGMPVGKSTFETCLWIGRIIEAADCEYTLVYRKSDGVIPGVSWNLCRSLRATDSTIRQALLDRFEPVGGGSTPQVGTKKEPGPLYGIKGHAWAALAVAVTWWDHLGSGANGEVQAEEKKARQDGDVS